MPLPTSDLQLEMKALREAYNQFSQLQQHEQLYQSHHHHPRIRPQLSLNSSQKSAATRQPSLADSKTQSEDKSSSYSPTVQPPPQYPPTTDSNALSPNVTALNLSPALIPQRSQYHQYHQHHHLAKDAFPFNNKDPTADQPLNKSADLASLDSSDTYASCQTHPCLSQGDLTTSADDLLDCNDDMLYNFEATANARTASIMDFLDYDHTNKLYVNPLQKSDSDAIKLQKKLSVSSMGIRGNVSSTSASPRVMSQVKKSASGGFGGAGGGSGGGCGGHPKYSNMNDLLSNMIKTRDAAAAAFAAGAATSSSSAGTTNRIGEDKPFKQRDLSVNLIDGLVDEEESSKHNNNNSEGGVGGGGGGGPVSGSSTSGVPKHRKTRFQQQQSNDGVSMETALTTANVMSAMRVQEGLLMSSSGGCLSTSSGGSSSTITGSQVSMEPNSPLNASGSVKVKCRRASFMPARSLASATKKINQHLFGAGVGSGTATIPGGSCSGGSNTASPLVLALRSGGGNNKKSLSMSNESIDSDAVNSQPVARIEAGARLEATNNNDKHRRSKSILKNKSDRLPTKYNSADPENERLLVDSSTAPDNGVGCDCEYSPQRTLIHAKSAAALASMTPSSAAQLRQQPRPLFVHQRSTPEATAAGASPRATNTAKYHQQPTDATELATMRQHRQQRIFKETRLQGSAGE